MALKIIGGQAKNFPINCKTNLSIRPTSVLLRRKLFDSLFNINDICFIDLCAGTGAMGLEALSRGASQSIFIEQNKSNFNQLKNNTTRFRERYGHLGESKIYSQDCLRWLKQWISQDKFKNVILFFDPPYQRIDLYQKVCAIIEPILPKLYYFIIESDRQKTMGLEQFEAEILPHSTKNITQGSSYLLIYGEGVKSSYET